MKKHSIFLLFCLTFSAFTVGQASAKPPSRRLLFFDFPIFPKPIEQPPETPMPLRAPFALLDCPAGRNALQCLPQYAGNSETNRTPIHSTCCAILYNATAECAGDRWPDFIPPALAYCQREHSEQDPSAPQASPLPPPPPQSQPSTPPQAPSALSDCRHTYLYCMAQFANHEDDHSPINSTCCDFLIHNATEECAGSHVHELWPQSIAYCQPPEQNSSPRQASSPPPPPPPSLPAPEESAQKCLSFINTMQSCINEIMSGFFNKRLGMGPACCTAMSSWGEDCFTELSRQFPALFYPSWLRQQCSLP